MNKKLRDVQEGDIIAVVQYGCCPLLKKVIKTSPHYIWIEDNLGNLGQKFRRDTGGTSPVKYGVFARVPLEEDYLQLDREKLSTLLYRFEETSRKEVKTMDRKTVDKYFEYLTELMGLIE